MKAMNASASIKRVIFVVVMTSACPSLSAHGQQFTSPEDLLSTLYEVYRSGRTIDNFEPYFSDKLTQEMSGSRITSDMLKGVGLDPITGSSRPGLLTTFDLATIGSNTITAEAVATFWNAGVPVSITFDLLFEDKAGWQIDHMAGVAGEASWCTNNLIAAARASSSSTTN